MKVKCANCKKEFDKKPSQIKKTNNNFCNSSCAAIYNNAKYPKRKKVEKYKCKDCNKPITHSENNRCFRCKRLHTLNIYSEKTLKEALYKNGDASLKFNFIRRRARSVLELEGRPKICENCEWNKHVHVAHIKALNLFDLDTKVKIVNAPSNLKYLCPNCHWEFDHK